MALVIALLTGIFVLIAMVAPHLLDTALRPAQPGGALAGDWPDLAGPAIDPPHARSTPLDAPGEQAVAAIEPRDLRGLASPAYASPIPGVPLPTDAVVAHTITRDAGGVSETITVWRFEQRSALEAFHHVAGQAEEAGWRPGPSSPAAPGFVAQAVYVITPDASPGASPNAITGKARADTLTIAARPDDSAQPDAPGAPGALGPPGARVTLWLRQALTP